MPFLRTSLATSFLFFLTVTASFCAEFGLVAASRVMNPPKENNMVLVVYYSRTGNTQKVAEDIARRLHADSERVTTPNNYEGLFGLYRGVRDAIKRRPVLINPMVKDPAGYGLVVIGTPIWGKEASLPMKTWLRQYGGKLPARVAYFCTAAGDPAQEHCFESMQSLTGKQPIATLGLQSSLLKASKKDIYEKRLSDFLAALK